MQWGRAAVALAALTGAAGCDLALSGLADAPRDAGGAHPTFDATTNDGAAPPASDASDSNDVFAPDAPGAADAAVASDATDACGAVSEGGAAIDTIAAIAPPPVIDGDLADWPCDGWMELSATTAAFAKTGGDVVSALVAVRWDANGVYVALKITDPIVGGNDPTNPYNNDAVEIFATGEATPTGDYDATSHQWVTDWKGLEVDYGPTHYGQPADTAPAHFSAKGTVVTGGWQFEASFGWQVVLPAAFASGAEFGFDVQLDDGNGTQQLGALILALAPSAGERCACTQVGCCCGQPVDLPYCDSARMARVTLE